MSHGEASTLQRVPGEKYTSQETRVGLWHCLVAWIFGSAFFAITTGAVFNSFVTKYLHTNDVTYSLLMSLGSLGVIFLLLGSYIVERRGKTKTVFLVVVTIHRLLWLGVALIPLILPVHKGASTTLQVILVCVFVLTSSILQNTGGAGWTAWMSQLVPRSIAGKFFGIRSRFGLISMVVVALTATWCLDQSHRAGWVYALIFGIAACCGATDILFFLPVREVARPQEEQPPRLLDILTLPWKNALFRQFTLYTAVTWIAYMMMGSFIWRFAFDSIPEHGLAMSDSMANLMLFVLPVSMMALVAPFWGQAIDKFGPKPVLATSSLAHIIIPSFWLLAHPGVSWFVPIIAIAGGLLWPGIDQVLFYVQLKAFPDHRRSVYTSTFLVIFGLAGMTGTILGGQYATFWQQHMHYLAFAPSWISHYHPVFLTSLLIRLLAFVFILPRLDLPSRGNKRQVVQTIMKDLSASVPGTLPKK